MAPVQEYAPRPVRGSRPTDQTSYQTESLLLAPDVDTQDSFLQMDLENDSSARANILSVPAKEHYCCRSVQIAVDKHYRLIHGCTSKVKFRPGRFTEIQRGAFYFLLVFLFAFRFELRDSAVSTLPLGHARHNAGIF